MRIKKRINFNTKISRTRVTSILLSLTGEIVTQPPTMEPPSTEPSTPADIPTDVTASQGGTDPPSGNDSTAAILGGIIAILVIVIMVLVVIGIVVIVCIRL